MKTKLKYNEEFQEVANYGDKEIHIRTFGHVEIDNNKKINLLCIAELYDLLNSGAVREDELPDIENPVMVSFTLLPELKHIHKKHRNASIEVGCGPDGTLEDVYEYMGGLNFDPRGKEPKVWFKTIEEAREFIRSKEINDSISCMGMLSGFVMDQYYNRAGETNWTRLDKIMTGK